MGDRAGWRAVGDEIYTVLADSDTFGTSKELLAADERGGCACATGEASDSDAAEAAIRS